MAAEEEIAAFFGERIEGLSDTDPEIAQELRFVAASLLENARSALDRLFIRYHVDPARLFDILRQNRMRWRFDNVSRMFQDQTVEAIETWPDSLDPAADRLALAKPMLLQEWCDSMVALFNDGRDVRVLEHDGQSSVLVSTELPADTQPTTAVALSESLERVEVGRLAMFGAARIDPEAGQMQLQFPEQFDHAITLLRKSAMTLRRRDLKSATDSATGKPVFGPGPRRRFVPAERTAPRRASAYGRP